MAVHKKANPKMILWVVLPSIFLILMLVFKFVAVKYDLENKREIDELIRKQQALRHVPAVEQQAASSAQALTTTSDPDLHAPAAQGSAAAIASASASSSK